MRLFNKAKFILKHRPWVVLALIFILGLFLRTLNLKDNVIFAYDQARDAQRIMDMVYNHDIKLVGPETDIPGVFNGVLFYLILLPVYAISGFDPNAASFFLIFLNLAVIPILYYLSVILFKNKYIGYIAGILWAVSFEQINFAKYISNASLMPLASTIFFLGLAIYLFQKKDWGFILSVIGLGASIHFNFYLVYLIVLYPIFFFLYKPVIRIKTILLSVCLLFFILFPFIIAEFRWHFPAVKGLLSYFLSHLKQSDGPSLSYKMRQYYERISEMCHYSFMAIGKHTSALFVLPFLFLGLLKLDNSKRTFLIICFFSTLPLFFFNSGVMTVQVINSSIFFAATLMAASGIFHLTQFNKGIGLIIIVAVMISTYSLLKQNNFVNNVIFASHPQLLKYEKQLIDYTYQSSWQKPFSICGIMSPLFTNTIWSFLYKTYGERKYGYLPTWAGQKQWITNNYLVDDVSHVENRYIIVEPVGIPDFARTATIYLEDRRSSLLNKKYFGEYIVQKRRLLRESETPIDTQKLPKDEIENIERVIGIEPRYYCYVGY